MDTWTFCCDCTYKLWLQISRYDFDLPQEQYISDDKQEDVRNWVITMSMDQQIDQSLSTRSCDHCGSDIYEASLICKSCKVSWELHNPNAWYLEHNSTHIQSLLHITRVACMNLHIVSMILSTPYFDAFVSSNPLSSVTIAVYSWESAWLIDVCALAAIMGGMCRNWIPNSIGKESMQSRQPRGCRLHWWLEQMGVNVSHMSSNWHTSNLTASAFTKLITALKNS